MLEIDEKIYEIKKRFSICQNPEQRYHFLIELGRKLPPYPTYLRIPALQIQGCQSILYMSSQRENDKIFFQAAADALISAGLAALLITIYSGETPEIILKTPPTFLKELNILESLTPSRSNGLAHIHQKMKFEALHALKLSFI